MAVSFTLAHLGGEPAQVAIEYDDGAGYRAVSDPTGQLAQRFATAPGSGRGPLGRTPPGVVHRFYWPSAQDVAGRRTLRVRVVASTVDTIGLRSDTRASAPFVVENYLGLSDTSTGSAPSFLAAGDLDRDGALDLAWARTTVSDSIRVALGRGDGTFGSAAEVLDVLRWGIALGDLDRDGHLDLLCGAERGGWVALHGRGDGGFAPWLDRLHPDTTGSSSVHIVTADVDGDGDLDVITGGVDDGDGALTVELGDGAGGFVAPATLVLGPGGVRDLVVLDLEQDGRAEVAAIHGVATSLPIVRWQPGVGPAIAGTLTLGRAATALVAGHVNLDAHVDVAAVEWTSSTTSRVELFLGDGQGGFGAAAPTDLVGSGGEMAAGDLDGDGRDEIVVAQPALHTLSVLAGADTGPLSIRTARTGDTPRRPILGDFDGDGRRDVALVHAGSGTYAILVNDGAGGVRARGTQPTDLGPLRLAAGRVDADGAVDLLASGITSKDGTGTAVLQLLRGVGDGFAAPQSWPLGASFAPIDVLRLADADGDGDLDALHAPARTSGGKAAITRFQDGAPIGSAAIDLSGVSGLDAADLDEDGVPDLVACAELAFGSVSKLDIRWGTGAGTFAAGPAMQLLGLASGVAVTDFDRDGHLDVAVSLTHQAASTGEVHIFRGPGPARAPWTVTATAVGDLPRAIAVGDLDGNGYPDVVTGNDRSLSVHIGFGDGTLVPETIYPLARPAIGVAVTDLDGDKHADVVVADAAGLTLFIGHGNGALQAPFSRTRATLPLTGMAVTQRNGVTRIHASSDASDDVTTWRILPSASCGPPPIRGPGRRR